MSSPVDRSRARKRRFRQRQKNGAVVLHIEVCEHTFAEALIVSGRLTEARALCRGEIEQAAGALLGEWAQQWVAERVPH